VKVYVVMDDRFPDPEAVFSKKKHAVEYAQAITPRQEHIKVYRHKVHDKRLFDFESPQGERIVTNPSSY